MGTQQKIDLWRNYMPFATQKRFLQSKAKYRLLSSGYGGGKTSLGCRESIRHAITYPGSRNGVFRNVGEHLRKTTMVTFWRETRTIGLREGVHYTYRKQEKELEWWNGSVTFFNHFEDVDALGSFEMNTAFIDEGSEVPDEIYAALFPGRLRSHLPACTLNERIQTALQTGQPIDEITCDCPQRAWICTNPGASGYLRAVIDGKAGPEWEWHPVKPAENPYNGPNYYREMQSKRRMYGEHWYKRYHDGDWTTFEGQRFPMFNHETHVVELPNTIHPKRLVYEGWDFGHRETFIVWFTWHPEEDEPIHVIDEHQHQQVQKPEDVAEAVHAKRAKWGIQNTVTAFGDPAGTANSQYNNTSPIAAYAKHGIHINPSRITRNPQRRADQLAERLTHTTPQKQPGILINHTCTALIHSITNLRWKNTTNNLGEPGKETFIQKDDHGFDALTYALAAVPPPHQPETPRIHIPTNPTAAPTTVPDTLNTPNPWEIQ